MRELSLNILDVAQNSISAGAKNIIISIIAQNEVLQISIEDDGKGMSEEFVSKVTDPFTTTRTTRKVGMGIPFFKATAEMSGGEFFITSKLGEGTKITASFALDNIDRMPLGDIAGTLTVLIMTKPAVDFVLNYTVGQANYCFDTKQIKAMLGDTPIDNIEIISYLEGMINDNISKINGGTVL